MEIDDLKRIWKKDDEPQGEGITNEEIKAMIRNKSYSTISKMKRVMSRKMWFASVLGFFIMIVAFVNYLDSPDELHFLKVLTNTQYNLMLFLMGGVVFFYSLYLRSVHNQITRLEKSSKPLRSMLKTTIKVMTKLIKVSAYPDAIGVPFFVSFLIYIYLFKDQSFVPDFSALLLIPIGYVVYLLVRAKQRRFEDQRYRPYINSLQGCLNDLEEQG